MKQSLHQRLRAALPSLPCDGKTHADVPARRRRALETRTMPPRRSRRPEVPGDLPRPHRSAPLTPDGAPVYERAIDTCPGGGMVDALVSGTSDLTVVEVRVFSRAPGLPRAEPRAADPGRARKPA